VCLPSLSAVVIKHLKVVQSGFAHNINRHWKWQKFEGIYRDVGNSRSTAQRSDAKTLVTTSSIERSMWQTRAICSRVDPRPHTDAAVDTYFRPLLNVAVNQSHRAASSETFVASESDSESASMGVQAYLVYLRPGYWPADIGWSLDGTSRYYTYGGVHSSANNSKVFQRNVQLAPGEHKLQMYDSFGDGWNGAEWSLYKQDEPTTSCSPAANAALSSLEPSTCLEVDGAMVKVTEVVRAVTMQRGSEHEQMIRVNPPGVPTPAPMPTPVPTTAPTHDCGWGSKYPLSFDQLFRLAPGAIILECRNVSAARGASGESATSESHVQPMSDCSEYADSWDLVPDEEHNGRPVWRRRGNSLDRISWESRGPKEGYWDLRTGTRTDTVVRYTNLDAANPDSPLPPKTGWRPAIPLDQSQGPTLHYHTDDGGFELYQFVGCSFPETVRYVDCGAHMAASCAECTIGHELGWKVCSGECVWEPSPSGGKCVYGRVAASTMTRNYDFDQGIDECTAVHPGSTRCGAGTKCPCSCAEGSNDRVHASLLQEACPDEDAVVCSGKLHGLAQLQLGSHSFNWRADLHHLEGWCAEPTGLAELCPCTCKLQNLAENDLVSIMEKACKSRCSPTLPPTRAIVFCVLPLLMSHSLVLLYLFDYSDYRRDHAVLARCRECLPLVQAAPRVHGRVRTHRWIPKRDLLENRPGRRKNIFLPRTTDSVAFNRHAHIVYVRRLW
jgi:hypothetical protein